MTKHPAARLLTLLFLLCFFPRVPAAAESRPASQEPDPLTIAQGIIDWKKASVGSAPEEPLLGGAFLELAGSTAGDWYPIGLSLLGKEDCYAAYLAVIRDTVEARYRQPGRLSAAKATEWHRIILSVLAAGGDPTAFGTDENGRPINLLADGVYDRGKTTSLGRQGINGWIWGLIALDSLRYEIPAGAYYSREEILTEILSRQLADGGWALSGSLSDPDLTAMAVQALAPYSKEQKEYVYFRKATGTEVTATVSRAVGEALACLSALQLPTGDYASWGTQNVESTDQVIIALCCLGIDPLRDSRFIKNGNTLLSGVLRYRQPNGGFVHSYEFDPNNPTALPDQANSMAGEQTLLAMAALFRQQNGLRTLYDFRPKNGAAPGDNAPSAFSDAYRQAVDSLPGTLTTEHYVTVTTLLDRLERSPDFAEKEAYRQKLTAAKERIAQIQAEIDSLNAEIRDKLYPFDSISLRDKRAADAIAKRYAALSEYDRTKITHWEDVVKARTQIGNLLRGLLIGLVLGAIAVLLTVYLILRIRKRRRRRARETEALAAQFADEDDEERKDGAP